MTVAIAAVVVIALALGYVVRRGRRSTAVGAFRTSATGAPYIYSTVSDERRDDDQSDGASDVGDAHDAGGDGGDSSGGSDGGGADGGGGGE